MSIKTYKLVLDFENVEIYYCDELDKYKIVDYKNGIETVMKVYDYTPITNEFTY